MRVAVPPPAPAQIPGDALPADVRHRRNVRRGSPATLRICSAGIRFVCATVLQRDWPLRPLLRAPRERTLPAVLSIEGVRRVRGCVRPVHPSACRSTVSSWGLRLQAGRHLAGAAIASARLLGPVPRGQGATERYVPLPGSTLGLLRKYWRPHRTPTLLVPAIGRGPHPAGPLPRAGRRPAGRACGRPPQAPGLAPYPAALLCHPSAGSGGEPPDHPAVYGPHGPGHPPGLPPPPPDGAGGRLPAHRRRHGRTGPWARAVRSSGRLVPRPWPPRAPLCRPHTAQPSGPSGPAGPPPVGTAPARRARHHTGRVWWPRRLARALPGHHFLLTFTVPEVLRPFLRSHQRAAERARFPAAAAALTPLARAARLLGGDRPGFCGVRPPGGRPRAVPSPLHGVVPGGAFSRREETWPSSRVACALPVHALRQSLPGDVPGGAAAPRPLRGPPRGGGDQRRACPRSGDGGPRGLPPVPRALRLPRGPCGPPRLGPLPHAPQSAAAPDGARGPGVPPALPPARPADGGPDGPRLRVPAGPRRPPSRAPGGPPRAGLGLHDCPGPRRGPPSRPRPCGVGSAGPPRLPRDPARPALARARGPLPGATTSGPFPRAPVASPGRAEAPRGPAGRSPGPRSAVEGPPGRPRPDDSAASVARHLPRH